MELTENERLMLVEKKEDILKLTKEILKILKERDPEQALEVKKKMTSILSLISTIGSYAKSKYDSRNLWASTNMIFLQMNALGDRWTSIASWIEVFCNTVNLIEFNFTKRDIKIKIPKIDMSIFRNR